MALQSLLARWSIFRWVFTGWVTFQLKSSNLLKEIVKLINIQGRLLGLIQWDDSHETLQFDSSKLSKTKQFVSQQAIDDCNVKHICSTNNVRQSTLIQC